ncbi:MAG: hypothetical protein H6708_28760 [Kofleriaceae bacterium]|nr:hypothetical protein [Kofleriaceae bacterium]
MLAATVWLLARMGIGHPDLLFVDALRTTTLFAGVAALLTAGGIGRLAAHASLRTGGRRTAIWRAARTQAVAGAGLVIIATIPNGDLPTDHRLWAAMALAGLMCGAVCGVLIGAVCSAPAAPRQASIPELVRLVPKLMPTREELAAQRREAAARGAPGPARGTAAPTPPGGTTRPR